MSAHTGFVDCLYQSLEPARKEIRVLRLDDTTRAGAGNNEAGPLRDDAPSGTLRFDLEVLSLLDQRIPFYEAISYCWSPHSQACEIGTATVVLNNRSVEVPATAEGALRGICAGHGHGIVWIDAVCINQIDCTERAQQVDLMGEIYSKAASTVMWLTQGSSSAVDEVRNLFKVLDRCLPSQWTSPSSSLEQDQRLKDGSVALTNLESSGVDWTSMYSFFANRWFTRAWIIQEVALAQVALCYQGDSSIAWNQVAAVATFLYKHRHKLPQHPGQETLRGIENAAQVWSLAQRRTQKLISLLPLTYTFDCKYPQDLVFAILGLRQPSAQYIDSPSRIAPSYTEPLQDVYGRATKAAIIESQSLGILKHAHSLRPLENKSQDTKDFPSWALRLDCRSEYHINPISYRGFRFNAHGGMPLRLWPNEPPKILRVMGLRYDVIVSVSPQIQWQDRPGSTAADAVKKTFRWACGTFGPCDRSALARNFAITLAAGQDADGGNVMATPKRLCEGFMRFLQADERDPTLVQDSDIVYALSAMIKSGHHRTVFVTRSGGLGLGTDNVEIDDVVCVLFGGSVPFVLRPETYTWKFVGDAFVEELMNGEYLRGLMARGRLERKQEWLKIE
ncbi:Heterokaryon incompatibility protein 6, OR allele [Fulvia fulva]|nr:Heterokaryon incompatibility protein 6, OR allele [Fulvia fulva]